MATIREVAKLAGVSVATVSRVLNKKGYVHEDTVKKVEEAIEKLQYKPNAVAKSLFKKSSTMLAVLFSDIEQTSFVELFTAIERTAYEAGYQVVVCNITDRTPYVDILLQNNVAGFIVTRHVYEQLKQKLVTVPFVVLDGDENETSFVVGCSEYEGARLATEFLLKKGSRFPAYIRGPHETAMMNQRFEGFLDVVEEQRIPYRLIDSELSVSDGERAALTLLRRAPYIDSIFACNDTVAIGAIRAAQKLGISVPQHLQVIGFDGISQGEIIYPGLTTVAQPFLQKGELATNVLLQQIQDKAAKRIYLLNPTIVERESTK
ncbi:LacI family DNA-binding transcriptional regulator [Microbacteriaceae bacterium 4G12]